MLFALFTIRLTFHALFCCAPLALALALALARLLLALHFSQGRPGLPFGSA